MRAQDVIDESGAPSVPAPHRTTSHRLERLPQLRVSGSLDQPIQLSLELPLVGVQHFWIDQAPLYEEQPLCEPSHTIM